jgi:sugar transferase EpsL
MQPQATRANLLPKEKGLRRVSSLDRCVVFDGTDNLVMLLFGEPISWRSCCKVEHRPSMGDTWNVRRLRRQGRGMTWFRGGGVANPLGRSPVLAEPVQAVKGAGGATVPARLPQAYWPTQPIESRNCLGRIGRSLIVQGGCERGLSSGARTAERVTFAIRPGPRYMGLVRLVDRCCKRCLDVSVASTGLLVLSPLLLGLAVLTIKDCGWPPLFAQNRPGYRAKIFRIYKFRTMTQETGQDGRLLPDADRLTNFGRWMRAASLDELPELWNVVRGEMSLVGPRPLLPQYLDRYNANQRRRHEAKPGITGWAQIHGRNALTWERKFELDVWYVDHASFWLDLRILGRTIAKVLRREGISAVGEATMPEFMGSDSTSAGSEV